VALPIFLGLNLLLLLEGGAHFSGVFVEVRQPQPDTCHMGYRNPRFGVSEPARQLQALPCAVPILVCFTRHGVLPGPRTTRLTRPAGNRFRYPRCSNRKTPPGGSCSQRGFCCSDAKGDI